MSCKFYNKNTGECYSNGAPENRLGKWVSVDEDTDTWACSKCNEEFEFDDCTPRGAGWKYCPCCGSNMEAAHE